MPATLVSLLLLLLVPLTFAHAEDQAMHVPVLILGAGMTGLTAARTLSAEYNVSSWLVVDALPRLGGRLHNIPFGTNYTVEVGANWVQGTQNNDTGVENPIWEIAQAYNVTTSYTDFSDVAPYNASGPIPQDVYDEVYNEYSDAFNNFTVIAGWRQANGLVDMNARGGFRVSGWQASDYLRRAVEVNNFDLEYGMPPEESSFIQAANNYNYSFLDFSPMNNLVVDPRGFSTVATAPLFAIPASQRGKILLNSTVTAISYADDGVNVTLSDGTLITSDYAICTFSVGVLQYGDIEFDPPLPQWKQDAIDGFAMSTYTKIFMQFDKKFWADNIFQMYADPHIRGYYTQFQSLDLEGFYPDSHILFTTVTNEGSVRVESMTDEAVQAEVLAVLGNMYGAENVANVTDFYFYRWHSDPLFRGSYSNWPAAYIPPSQDNLRAALNGRLLFAGEATSFEYYGFLQGAYTEGKHAGEGVGRCLTGGAEEGCLEDVYWGQVVEGNGIEQMFE